MWHGRGEQQVLSPMGSVIQFDPDKQVYIQTTEFEDTAEYSYQREGYNLSLDGYPIFNYRLSSLQVRDQIRPDENTPTLQRILHFHNTGEQAYDLQFRIASASQIEEIAKGIYSIGGRNYFIRVKRKANIIEQNGTWHLVVPLKNVDSESRQLAYSIIW